MFTLYGIVSAMSTTFGKISLVKTILDMQTQSNYNIRTIIFGVDMSEFWIGFWSGILVWYLLRLLIKQIIVALVLNIAKDKIEELKAQEDEIFLKLEKHGDMIYCYRKDTDEFIGQAKSLEEIADLYKKKYPNNNARILKEDAAGIENIKWQH